MQLVNTFKYGIEDRLIGAVVTYEAHVTDIDSDFDDTNVEILFKKRFLSKRAADAYFEAIDIYSELPQAE